MALSGMGLKLGVSGFLLTTYAKKKGKANTFTIFMCIIVQIILYLHTQTEVDAGDLYTPDKPRLRENLNK